MKAVRRMTGGLFAFPGINSSVRRVRRSRSMLRSGPATWRTVGGEDLDGPGQSGWCDDISMAAVYSLADAALGVGDALPVVAEEGQETRPKT